MLTGIVRCRARSAGILAALAVAAAAGALCGADPPVPAGSAPLRPNILWITSEDNGPHLGCYGDDYADTPHLDALAARSLLYRHCWSNAPVCAPARTAIISGLFPPSTGAEHMRSMARLPDGFLMFPAILRAHGYYCTNHVKEDYNLEKTGQVWDESSNRAHYKNRRPGQPFFAVFNHTVSHESQIRRRPHAAVHDPAAVHVPAYHPDTPEVRQDWAQYYDKLTEMDALVGKNLAELEAAGLADDTVVVYFGDHGSGMPRNKRWLYQSGLHVPLIVHIPQKFAALRPAEYRSGGESERLVSFVDLAPTMLSLAGIEPPAYLHGGAFAGPHAAPPHEYLYGFRGRMDERYDSVRAVRDGRWLYIRNFMPHLPYGQHVSYMFETPTTRVWQQQFHAGKLTPEQARFWQAKPAEELYDLAADPEQVRDLAADERHAASLARMRGALRAWQLEIRDLGLLPEAEMHARAGDSSFYEFGHDSSRYPLELILAAADRATLPTLPNAASVPLAKLLSVEDSAVRYWGVVGLQCEGADGVAAARSALRRALDDSSASVRVAAAEALAQYGDEEDRTAALAVLLKHAAIDRNPLFVTVHALNAIDHLDEAAAPLVADLQKLPKTAPGVSNRTGDYVERLLRKTLADLGER